MTTVSWLPQIDLMRCTGCQRCITTCTPGALHQRAGKAALVAPHLCTYCGLCEDICPSNAIELPFLIVKHPTERTLHEKNT